MMANALRGTAAKLIRGRNRGEADLTPRILSDAGNYFGYNEIMIRAVFRHIIILLSRQASGHKSFAAYSLLLYHVCTLIYEIARRLRAVPNVANTPCALAGDFVKCDRSS